MIRTPKVDHHRSVWPREQRLLLLALVVFLAATSIFDVVIVVAAPRRIEAAVLIITMAFFQVYVIWFSFMRAAPALKKTRQNSPHPLMPVSGCFWWPR